MKKRIYLDNNATTAVDPRVCEVVYQELKSEGGNPSSIHSFGREAKSKLNQARAVIAKFLGVSSQEIIFTSGGTEAANFLLRGLFSPSFNGHIITSNVEHSAVYTTMQQLVDTCKLQVSFLSAGKYGSLTLEAIESALKPNTKAIVLMAVNNETGVKTDIEKIASFASDHGLILIVDGVALMGKEPFKVPKGVCAMFFSGHKFHAPKGVGFLYLRNGLKVSPLITGGVQEFGRRAGTQNLPAIMGMVEAIKILENELADSCERMLTLRNLLETLLLEKIPGCRINGQGPRVCNTSNIFFPGIEGEVLLAKLDRENIAVSHGSACASGALEPSRILLNMGMKIEDAACCLRISLSRFSTEQEIRFAVEAIVRCCS